MTRSAARSNRSTPTAHRSSARRLLSMTVTAPFQGLQQLDLVEKRGPSHRRRGEARERHRPEILPEVHRNHYPVPRRLPGHLSRLPVGGRWSRPASSWNSADKSRCETIASETASKAQYPSPVAVACPSKGGLVIAKPWSVTHPEPAKGPPHPLVFPVACVMRILPGFREAGAVSGYPAGVSALRSATRPTHLRAQRNAANLQRSHRSMRRTAQIMARPTRRHRFSSNRSPSRSQGGGRNRSLASRR
jgi:hypothetical protein